MKAMPEIKDTGKVWIKGRVSTAFAIKVDDIVFVAGQEEGQDIEFWLQDNALCVDLHDAANETRIARRFSLDLQAQHPATLFNGFNKTKHCDTQVVLPGDDGVQETRLSGEGYRDHNAGNLDSRAFWKRYAP
jgi:hypothetical protein